jgi:VWFA-related protein
MARPRAVALCAAAAAFVATAAVRGQVFRAGADTVPVFVTATDRTGRLVTDLARDEFVVSDDGVPQPLIVFDSATQPIRLIVLLDVSGSMKFNLSLMRASCAALLQRLGPRDVARVGTFGEVVKISPVFSQNVNELMRVIPTFKSPSAAPPPRSSRRRRPRRSGAEWTGPSTSLPAARGGRSCS